MRKCLELRSLCRSSHRAALQMLRSLVVLAIAAGATGDARAADRDALDGVVQIIAHVPQDARTAATLGTERQGSGVVIDDSGLILTIGYLILEAMEIEIQGAAPQPVPARVVAYDHETGFGLVRADNPSISHRSRLASPPTYSRPSR